jgi:hypothetical protein
MARFPVPADHSENGAPSPADALKLPARFLLILPWKPGRADSISATTFEEESTEE